MKKTVIILFESSAIGESVALNILLSQNVRWHRANWQAICGSYQDQTCPYIYMYMYVCMYVGTQLFIREPVTTVNYYYEEEDVKRKNGEILV